MKNVQIFPYTLCNREEIESISFNGMSREQADALALAFAHAPFHVSVHDTGDTSLRYVVNIQGSSEDKK